LPLASLSSGLPRNPNVLLIRTHPNPTPSVANKAIVVDIIHNLHKPKGCALSTNMQKSRDWLI
jgi:hypothetical protein